MASSSTRSGGRRIGATVRTTAAASPRASTSRTAAGRYSDTSDMRNASPSSRGNAISRAMRWATQVQAPAASAPAAHFVPYGSAFYRGRGDLRCRGGPDGVREFVCHLWLPGGLRSEPDAVWLQRRRYGIYPGRRDSRQCCQFPRRDRSVLLQRSLLHTPTRGQLLQLPLERGSAFARAELRVQRRRGAVCARSVRRLHRRLAARTDRDVLRRVRCRRPIRSFLPTCNCCSTRAPTRLRMWCSTSA